MSVDDPELVDLLGNTRFYSITYRLFKSDALEWQNEDYGQIAVYKGTIPDNKHGYVLDHQHRFESHKVFFHFA
jgi:hypothetical protein